MGLLAAQQGLDHFVDADFVVRPHHILFCLLAGKVDHQDWTWIETTVARSLVLLRPYRSGAPHGDSPGVVRTDNYSCFCGRRGSSQSRQQFSQRLVGKRQVIDVGAGAAPVISVIRTRRMRHAADE